MSFCLLILFVSFKNLFTTTVDAVFFFVVCFILVYFVYRLCTGYAHAMPYELHPDSLAIKDRHSEK